MQAWRRLKLCWKCHVAFKLRLYPSRAGVEDDDATGDDAPASTEDMPPLEGDDEDASRMEEVD